MRRKLLAALLTLFLGITPAHTQQGASAFIGEWKGQIEGIGEARLVIAAVKSNGQIEGQMEFSLKSFVSTFGDKADSAKNTSLGIVSGSTLSIESALGGKYELARTGNQLTGVYTRGTTYRGSASFTKT
jgi:hypothetical protein